MKSLKDFIKTKIVEWCINIMFPCIPNWIKKELKLRNILVCGQTGSGKSSIINYLAGKNIAEVGDVEPTTKDIKYYETKYINIYDSEGYEIDSDKQEHYNELIMKFLKTHKNTNKKGTNHLIWYCISGAGKRYIEVDKCLIKELKKEGFKICVLITKIDEITKKQFIELCEPIKKDFKNINIFKLSTKKSCSRISEWKKLLIWVYKSSYNIFKK